MTGSSFAYPLRANFTGRDCVFSARIATGSVADSPTPAAGFSEITTLHRIYPELEMKDTEVRLG